MNLFSIKDAKSGSFGAPFAAPNGGAATRTVSMAMEDKTSLLARFPGDFELWQMGSLDETSGVITSSLDFVVNLATLKGALHDENA